MENPKVSVLIPLYNRKENAAQCIDSVLNQVFEDYEIVLRDDCSTDGVFEFVEKKYTQQISDGKIKLYRNEKNLGEFATVERMKQDAAGKYITILHNDDMYLPHTLKHLYEVAEQTKADVVHESFVFMLPSDGNYKNLKTFNWDRNVFKEVTVIPQDQSSRFKEWLERGTFHDAQYNLFNKEFLVNNNIKLEFDNLYTAFLWIMKAKVLVKTPIPCYITRRDLTSQSNAKFNPPELERRILSCVEIIEKMEKHFEEFEIFSDKKYLKYMALAHLISIYDDFFVTQRKLYKDGITPEIYDVAEKTFQKVFGENYFYPMFLFHWIHSLPYKQKVDFIHTSENIPSNS